MQKQTRYSTPNCLGSESQRTKDAEVREELEDLGSSRSDTMRHCPAKSPNTKRFSELRASLAYESLRSSIAHPEKAPSYDYP